MGTQAFIGYRDEMGMIRAAHVAYDGYTTGVGATLQEFYRDAQKIETLVNMGSLRGLKSTLAAVEVYPDGALNMLVCSDVEEYRTEYRCSSFASYAYLWDGEQWLVSDYGSAFIPLTQALEACGIIIAA